MEIWLLLGIKPKDVCLVVMLSEVQQNGSRLKDNEVVPRMVNQNGDPSIGVQLDEPIFLKDRRAGI
jgi:hypothetical protein